MESGIHPLNALSIMSKNLSSIDRTIRLVLAAVIVGVSLQQQLSGTPLLLWSLLAVVLAGTGTFGYCPLYALLGINTRRSLHS